MKFVVRKSFKIFKRERQNNTNSAPILQEDLYFSRTDKTMTDFTIPSLRQNKVEIVKDCQMRTTEPLGTECLFRPVKTRRAFSSKSLSLFSFIALCEHEIWGQHLIR